MNDRTDLFDLNAPGVFIHLIESIPEHGQNDTAGIFNYSRNFE